MSDLRIGGLATGMDIDSIVSDLMRAHRIPLDRMFQQKQELEWKQEDYREINSQLSLLRESAFNLKLERTFNVKAATSSDEDVVEVSASGNALNGTYSISVSQLAKGAYLTSSSDLGSSSDTTTLATQLGLSGTYTFAINGVQVTVNADTESMSSLVNKINSAEDAEGNSTGVWASYDSELDRFFLSTTETGAQARIDIDDVDRGTELFSALNITITNEADSSAEAQGQDAVFTLNGAQLTKSTNSFTINNVNYNLRGVSSPGAETTIIVQTDEEQIYETIVSFIETYNETITMINNKLTERYYSDYPPLTDEMRKELDEDQIEEWNERARSGLLRNDPLLTNIVGELRLAMSSVVDNVEGSFSALSEIGITTSFYYERGILHIDEDTLRKAISDDLEGVKELFTNASEGIAKKLYDEVVDGISLLTTKAGVGLRIGTGINL